MTKPWGIHRLGDMIGNPDSETPDGRAVPEPYGGRRLLKAWWVLTGRAEAVIWPKPGELERAIVPMRPAKCICVDGISECCPRHGGIF